MIKAIIFDLGNVIVSFDHNKIAKKLESVCEYTSDEVFCRAISSTIVREYNLGKISSSEFFEAVNRELNLQIDFVEFSQAWNCTFLTEPIIPEQIIKSLSEKYKLIVLSDTNELHFDFIKENFSALNYFDDFVLSHKVSFLKPSAQIFRAAVERADCSPEECLFIDDSEANVEGAGKLGINGILFISPEQLEKDLKLRGLI
jgi:glucose-1-phosphatase